MAGAAKANFGPLQGAAPYGGTFTGDQMYGKFAVTPVEGDCVATPITKVHLRCDESYVPQVG